MKKTHKLTLGSYSEEVTEAELANVKKALGPQAFSQYDVSDLQPEKPADLLAKTEPKTEPKPKKD